MQLGFSGWIDDQFTRPVCKLEPFVIGRRGNSNLRGRQHQETNCMVESRHGREPRSVPMTPTRSCRNPAPARGFALSQIFVVSDRPETLAVQPGGSGELLRHAAERCVREFPHADLIDVTLHPVMGVYLSHLLNKQRPQTIFFRMKITRAK